MPAGKNKKQTPRHDGGVSRVCYYCGGVGARCRDHMHRMAHRRCIPKQSARSIEELDRAWREESVHGPAITSKTSVGHIRTARFGLNKEKS